MSKFLGALKISAVPLMFAVAALSLATVHLSLQRKAERARLKAAQTVSVKVSATPDRLTGLKLPDVATAAEKGDLSAVTEMGRRYAQGEGVTKSRVKAAAYFQAVADRLGEIGPRDYRAPLAVAAYRYLAQYHRSGVPEANIRPDPALAFHLLNQAASYFGDPAAAYELAKMLLDGDGVTKNTRLAAQWLQSASRKGYAPAQALLGEMLWRGNGVQRVPGQGLGLLAIARRNALPEDKAWVGKMYETARAEASPLEIIEANAFMVQESGASPFQGASGSPASSETKEGADAGAAGTAAAQAGPEIPSRFLRGPLADFATGAMVIGPEAFNRGLSVRKGAASVSPGIVQMYRPWELETHTVNTGPLRLAGMGMAQ
jgi:hypothetical protein